MIIFVLMKNDAFIFEGKSSIFYVPLLFFLKSWFLDVQKVLICYSKKSFLEFSSTDITKKILLLKKVEVFFYFFKEEIEIHLKVEKT